MSVKRTFLALLTHLLIMHAGITSAQDATSALVPMPNSIEACPKNKTVQFDTKTAIKSNLPEDVFVIKEAKRILHKRMGISPGIDNSRKKNIVELAIDTTLHGEEHYTLTVDKRGITIKGASEGALFWGLQTLDQILLGDVINTAKKQIGYKIGRASCRERV